jgi:hypothetical protein
MAKLTTLAGATKISGKAELFGVRQHGAALAHRRPGAEWLRSIQLVWGL